MTTLRQLLLRTQENLLTLQVREAKYGGNAPLDLLNQIKDHLEAIELIQQALAAGLTGKELAELKVALRSLLVAGNVESISLDDLKPEIPPLPFEPEVILIPAGPFLMGSPSGENIPAYETPQHEVDLPAYQIGKYPVTNEQYAEFVRQTKHPAPQKLGWLAQAPPQNKRDHPVTGVSWYDAMAYCQWLSQQTGRVYRLPTEAEWEKAARGADGRLYPWGNTPETNRCNCANSQTAAVTAYPAGQSPYGCYDLLGNAWEWTTTLWGQNWQESDFRYPYRLDDGREDVTADAGIYRLFRGGAFSDDITQLRCSIRRWYAPTHADKARGFRVVLEIEL